MAASDLLHGQIANRPIIYAYSDTRYPNMLKVGYTSRAIEVRMKEHYPTLVPGQSWKVELIRPAMRQDGSVFIDKEVHKILRKAHVPNPEGEWFVCDTRKVEQAILAVQQGEDSLLARTQDFAMRPEQARAVKTAWKEDLLTHKDFADWVFPKSFTTSKI